jgi:protoporphyrin/coproporphyrin ferrochelatase
MTATLKAPADGFVSAFPETRFDALVVVSFGGPEGMDDVMPFLENVTRGRNVPRARLDEVAHHYALFGGVSPINAQNRALIDALGAELAAHAIDLPIYFGNRNWHPFLPDTLRQMADDGVERALAFFTSAYSSYSGCRQYREDLFAAQQAVGAEAPEVLRLRAFFNHPLWIEANADHVRRALDRLPGSRPQLVFTAHSIPVAMARACRYEDQLRESARLVAESVGVSDWALVYQSRSGPPHVPWLEPDVLDHLREVAARGVEGVVLSPIGFVSDHLEVLYDLDVEALDVAAELGLPAVRASSASTHPAFVAMIRELIEERLGRTAGRSAVGRYAASHDVCPTDCCLPGTGRASPWAAIRAGREPGATPRAGSPPRAR